MTRNSPFDETESCRICSLIGISSIWLIYISDQLESIEVRHTLYVRLALSSSSVCSALSLCELSQSYLSIDTSDHLTWLSTTVKISVFLCAIVRCGPRYSSCCSPFEGTLKPFCVALGVACLAGENKSNPGDGLDSQEGV